MVRAVDNSKKVKLMPKMAARAAGGYKDDSKKQTDTKSSATQQAYSGKPKKLVLPYKSLAEKKGHG